jgi:hypothetical protein
MGLASWPRIRDSFSDGRDGVKREAIMKTCLRFSHEGIGA